ncbi:hypothetical protein MKX08_005761 [Trichoderma sp. CBMAI-0020]|nr:hypothetical protein MKX08_005761 [Trichoderma sp. CBMAI-0020]
MKSSNTLNETKIMTVIAQHAQRPSPSGSYGRFDRGHRRWRASYARPALLTFELGPSSGETAPGTSARSLLLMYAAKRPTGTRSVCCAIELLRMAPAGCLQDQRADVNVNLEYVTLTREVPAGQPENPAHRSKTSRFLRMVGNSCQAVDMIVVPREEITTFEAQDQRNVDRPVDVVSYDKPVADTDLYLEHAKKFVSAAMTKNNWRPGQLIGPDGSDPETMNQSPSYAPHTVKEENWSTDPLSPFVIVNEAGEVVETVANRSNEKTSLPNLKILSPFMTGSIRKTFEDKRPQRDIRQAPQPWPTIATTIDLAVA